MEKYRIGYVAEPIDPADMYVAGHISIPYITRGGVKALKFRCVRHDDCHALGHSKYVAPQGGQPARIYNARAFFDAGAAIGVAEGEIDAICATEHVGLPTIGIPGTESWTAHKDIWKLTLRDYDVIYIFADGDDPGRKYARAIAADLGSRARLVRCDDGEDVSSLVVAGRVGELQEKAGIDANG